MTNYRGVEKEDVIASLREGEAFVRSLNLGPATEAALDKWLTKSPYKRLESAKSDQAFAFEMSMTSADGFFFYLAPVFKLHAVKNNDKKIYSALNSWEAFTGEEWRLGYDQLHRERDLHLALEHTAELAKEGGSLSDNAHKGIETVLNIFRGYYDDDYNAVEKQIQNMVSAMHRGDRAGAVKIFTESDDHYAEVMVAALHSAADIENRLARLSVPEQKNPKTSGPKL